MALDPQKQVRANEITEKLRQAAFGKARIDLAERTALQHELATIYAPEPPSPSGALSPEKQARVDQINTTLREVALGKFMPVWDRHALVQELGTLIEPPADAGGAAGAGGT